MERIKVWVQEFQGRKNLMLQWFDPETGKRRTQSAKTDVPDKAERVRADKEYELNNGLHTDDSNLRWSVFREIFEVEYCAGLRARSREKFATVFAVLEDEMSPDKLVKMDERFLSRFVTKLRTRTRKRSKGKKSSKSPAKVGLAPITIRNYMIAIKTMLNWAADQGFIRTCPKFPKIKVAKKKPQPVPTASFEKLLEAETDPLWRIFMCCGWWAGMRLSEVYALRWDPSQDYPWIDWGNERIVLPADFAKSGEDQWIPLHPELKRMLHAIKRTDAKVFPFKNKSTGCSITRTGITNHILAVARRAGVKLSMHRLRKGFGCRAAATLGKGNAPILHRLMRHSSMQITMDYYANVDDTLQAAIEALK